MKLNIDVNTNKHCRIIITDNTVYPDESRVNHKFQEFKQSESLSIVSICHNKLKEATYQTFILDYTKPIEIPIKLDGWFTVYYIVLPTKEWVESESEITSGSNLTSYDWIYCTDGDKIYRYLNGEYLEIDSIQTLITIYESTDKHTISLTKSEHISICYLWKCYIDLCKQLFESRALSTCGNRSKIDSELVFKRDLVWMAINVVNYLSDLHSDCNPTLSEIERIIEIIHSCNGVCKSPDMLLKSYTNDCGCSQK